MKLSKIRKYALRTMIELALAKSTISAQHVAEKQNIPLFYLKKILLKLKNYGLLKVTHGKNGGYALKKELSEITLKDIFVAAEGPIVISSCLDKNDRKKVNCHKQNICLSRPAWVFFNKKIEEALSSISLENILSKNVGLENEK